MKYLTFEKLPQDLKNQAIYQDIAAKQILFQQSEATDSIYFLIEGQVRLASVTEERIINHYLVLAGESFAETALFAEHYFYMAIADMPSKIVTINKEIFYQAIMNTSTLANTYINQLTIRLQTVKNLLELRSIRSARERILHYLIHQSGSDNTTIILQSSLKDLAIELGLSAEALSRNLSTMEYEGIISRKKRSITLNQDWLTIDNK